MKSLFLVVVVLVLVALSWLLTGVIVQFLWNALIPVTGLVKITLQQGVLIGVALWVVSLFFKNASSGK